MLRCRHLLIDDVVFQELDYIGKMKLNELVMSKNPIANESSYRNEVQMRIASLKVLDTQPLQPLISFNLPEYVTSSDIPPIQGSYFDAPVRIYRCLPNAKY
jgi:hypothetical protein